MLPGNPLGQGEDSDKETPSAGRSLNDKILFSIFTFGEREGKLLLGFHNGRSQFRWRVFEVRRFEVIFLVFFPTLVLTFNSGCADSRSYYSRYVEAPEGKVFFNPTPHFENSAFFSKETGSWSEHDKIRYLLNRMAESHDHFIRNGEAYDGKTARQWLLFKLSRWAGEIKTARDFVVRLSFSRQSGKPYVVESSEGKIYSLRSILKNELSACEGHLVRNTPTTPGAIPKPAPVSISPTTVATVAVAHSTN